MIPLDAIEPSFVALRFRPRWTDGDRLLRMLHGLTISEHPYAYLVATEQRPRPRA